MSSNDTDKRTAIEELRLLVADFNRCSQSFLDRFTVEQLLVLHHAHQACMWGIYPDQWTERQVKEALKGKVPKWDSSTKKPVYDGPPSKDATDVMFRVEDDGRVLAVFPGRCAGPSLSDIETYSRFDGHNAADVGYVTSLTGRAKPEQYQKTFDALERLGYELRVVQRMTKRHAAMRTKGVAR